jgi:hypothetical protein
VGQRDDLIESITRALAPRRGSRSRTTDGEHWLDCRCPLHDDAHRSASFSLDKGTFVCSVCAPGHSIPLDRVAAALSIADLPHQNGHTPILAPTESLVESMRWSYDYYWPNGELSHRHWRIQFVNLDPKTGKPRKKYLHQAPSGDWSRPTTFYPLYSDFGIPQGCHLVITEGEPPCDAINARQLKIAGVDVHAITAGSTADLVAARAILVSRLQEIVPSTVTLWPDADEPGIRAMREVRKYLQEAHIQVALLDPKNYQLKSKEDAVEFLQRGGNLALLLSGLHRPGTGAKPEDVADRITVLAAGALWPGTQALVDPSQTNCSAIWQSVVGKMPLDREAKELSNLLRHRAATKPVPAHWRLKTTREHTIWRPEAGKDCWRLSAEGIDVIPGPDDAVLLSPGPSVVPADVDLTLDGEGYYNQLCDLFGLSELERALILAWWICCLTGRETPILLMRGLAGTGKSTLASYILGLVEPSLREIQVPDQRTWTDDRQLIKTLEQVPALLADNVTALSSVMEDTLSKLVTGYNASVMWKYSNQVEQIRMRRAILITTTNYDVYKGDLASRMIVCNPSVSRRIDRDALNDRYMPMLPAIRGWVFKLVCQSYLPHDPESSWRVASVGEILGVLGYDARAMAAEESEQKARILNQNDPWLPSLVDIWDRHNQGGEFLFSHGQIVQEMREYGVPLEVLPQMGSAKFARWVEEKYMLLRDHGFWMERYRGESGRGYWFRKVKT